jgi:CHAT domain
VIFVGDGGPRLDGVDAERLATLFRGRRSVRLVVLTACASAVFNPATPGLFAGVGPALVRARVPAVVAMQYPTVQLDTASAFSRSFYRKLADGLAVDLAVTSGRTAIAAGGLLDGRDWSTPVLYLDTRTGRLFNLADAPRPEIQKQWDAVTVELAEASTAKAAFDELARQLRDLADCHRRLAAISDLNRRLREVEAAYAPLRTIVDAANGEGGALQLADLLDRWRELHDTRWADLESCVARAPELASGSWYAALRDAVTTVDADVARQARRPLAQDSVFDLGRALSQAVTAAHDDLSRALDEVMRLSARTVGQLPPG